MNQGKRIDIEFWNQKVWSGHHSFHKKELATFQTLKDTVNVLNLFDSNKYNIDSGEWSDKTLRFDIDNSDRYDEYGEQDLLYLGQPTLINVSVVKYKRRGIKSILSNKVKGFYWATFKTRACHKNFIEKGYFTSDNINEISINVLKIVQYIFEEINKTDGEYLNKAQCKKLNSISDFDF